MQQPPPPPPPPPPPQPSPGERGLAARRDERACGWSSLVAVGSSAPNLLDQDQRACGHSQQGAVRRRRRVRESRRATRTASSATRQFSTASSPVPQPCAETPTATCSTSTVNMGHGSEQGERATAEARPFFLFLSALSHLSPRSLLPPEEGWGGGGGS
jgi:hypothetical protein